MRARCALSGGEGMRYVRIYAVAVALTTLLCVGALGVGWAGSVALASSSPRIVARVDCARPAEDTLAHVRLVSLTHAGDVWTVRYRCTRGGY